MRLKMMVAAAAALSLGSQVAVAADGDFALGLKASTLGAGLEMTANASDSFNIRGLVSGYSYNKNIKETNVTYEAKLKLLSAGAIADYYPFEGKFRLSAGAFYNGNKFTGTGTPTVAGTYTFNGVTYTTAQIGSVNTKIEFNKFAPYLGLGWGNAVQEGSPFGFNFEVGALYQGKPKSSITTSGTVAGLDANLAAEKQKLDNSLKNFKWWPVVALGVTYRF